MCDFENNIGFKYASVTLKSQSCKYFCMKIIYDQYLRARFAKTEVSARPDHHLHFRIAVKANLKLILTGDAPQS